ncbi:MAG: hypothetical protein ACFBWO_13605 [Paracoccaceae bacterium]
MRTPLLVCAGACVLAGCAGGLSSEQTLRDHGYSEAYVAGYHDGCPSGARSEGAFTREGGRDEIAYESDADYGAGWDYGFVSCAEREREDRALSRAIGDAIAAGSASAHGADGIDTRKILSGIDTSAIRAAGW